MKVATVVLCAAWSAEPLELAARATVLQDPDRLRFMRLRLDRTHRALPVVLGAVTLSSVAALFLWDAMPTLFPSRAHDWLGAAPLALIAVAYLLYQSVRRPAAAEVFKAVLLAAAFLFWAANQLWPDAAAATLFNDIAIGLFVLDVFLVMVGWPASSPDESVAETYVEPRAGKTDAAK